MSIAHLYSAISASHALVAAHADAGVDLGLRAHARRAMQDALFQRLRGAGMHVLDRHLRLDRRHAEHRAQRRARLRRAAIDDARLVEMDVRLDQSRAGELPLRVVDLRVGRDGALDRNDAPVRDADVERRAAAIGQARIADDEVHLRPAHGLAEDRYPFFGLMR